MSSTIKIKNLIISNKANRSSFDGLLTDFLFKIPQSILLFNSVNSIKVQFKKFEEDLDNFMIKKYFFLENWKAKNYESNIIEPYLDLWQPSILEAQSIKDSLVDIKSWLREGDVKKLKELGEEITLMEQELVKLKDGSEKFNFEQQKAVQDADTIIMHNKTRLDAIIQRRKLILEELHLLGKEIAKLEEDEKVDLAAKINFPDEEKEENPYLEEKEELEAKFKKTKEAIAVKIEDLYSKIKNCKVKKESEILNKNYEANLKRMKDEEKNFQTNLKMVNESIAEYNNAEKETSNYLNSNLNEMIGKITYEENVKKSELIAKTKGLKEKQKNLLKELETLEEEIKKIEAYLKKTEVNVNKLIPNQYSIKINEIEREIKDLKEKKGKILIDAHFEDKESFFIQIQTELKNIVPIVEERVRLVAETCEGLSCLKIELDQEIDYILEKSMGQSPKFRLLAEI